MVVVDINEKEKKNLIFGLYGRIKKGGESEYYKFCNAIEGNLCRNVPICSYFERIEDTKGFDFIEILRISARKKGNM